MQLVTFSPLTSDSVQASGYTIQELFDAGYTALMMKRAAYTPQELKDVGYTAAELKVWWHYICIPN